MTETTGIAAPTRSRAQRAYERTLLAVLLNLVMLGLFAEHWSWVHADSFSVLLIAALVLQLLLQITIQVEQALAGFFVNRAGRGAKIARFFSTWFLLAGSKFAMLGILSWVFSDLLHFGGPYHGVIAFVVVVMSMLLAEQVAVRVYRRLA
ncbi:MAG: hypothetical protein AAGM16_01575 [Pseudomonadota bacterium]|mgnify:CR=1 FL=1